MPPIRRTQLATFSVPWPNSAILSKVDPKFAVPLGKVDGAASGLDHGVRPAGMTAPAAAAQRTTSRVKVRSETALE